MSAADEWGKVDEEHARAPLDALRYAAGEYCWRRSLGGDCAAMERLEKQIEAFDLALRLLEDLR